MQSTEIHPGDILAGKYRVRAILGRNHGLLVDAFHTEFDQRVIIKVLTAASGDSKEIERFRREARTLAKLSSEHAARILDVGTEPDGSFYLVREYLEGTDLAHYLRTNGRLALSDAVLLILQAAEAAAETHSHGIIVREIQPSTLFLTQRAGGAPLLKIVDFGTAKLMNAAAAPGAGGELTATAMFGLSQYSSPEMIRKAKSADGRTDVWSLGCILYEMLTGRAPFTGEAAMLMLQITREEPTPPSHVVPELPPDIDQVISWAIAKDVDARFKNMYAFAHALRPFAPPEGQILVDRIGQILEQGKRRPKPASLPPPAAPPPRPSAPAPAMPMGSVRAPRGEESFTQAYVPPARGSSNTAVAQDDATTRVVGTGDFAAQPPAAQPPPTQIRTVPPPPALPSQLAVPAAAPSQPATPEQASSPPGGYASASVPPGRPSSPGYSQSDLQASGPVPAYAPPRPKGLLDRRIVVGALAAVAVLLPAMIAILVMSRSKNGDAPPTPTVVTIMVPAPPVTTAAVPTVAPTPTAVAAPAPTPTEPPAASASAQAVAASDPTTKKGVVGSGGGGTPRDSTPVKSTPPEPKPTATAKVETPPSGGGGTGTLMAVAVGGTCNFSVNGSSKGSGSSVRVTLPPGSYSVMCKPSGGAIKSKTISVKSGETAMATFKL